MAAGFRSAIKGCTNESVKVSYRQLAASYEQLAQSVEHLYEIGIGREGEDPKDH
ncbi:MAG: hypothetical protein JNL04_24715 [Rhodospirillaceae bacterium]|nr:hypothetical protein [Rhodospirillaceae bacterium]